MIGQGDHSLMDGFEAAMAGLGPFEEAPHLAVALSGGADSTALVLLASAWAQARGGRVTALLVDHGLRPESAAEAQQVMAAMVARGVACERLGWEGEKPRSGVQAKARDARYRLMESWCEKAGVLHLLLGHHAGDQEETFFQRLSHGSHAFGLAGMAALVEKDRVRLVRPLLAFEKPVLEAWLRRQGVTWVEDPSNRNAAFQRVRLREALAAEGGDTARMVGVMAALGRQRGWVEQAMLEQVVRSVWLYPFAAAAVEEESFKAMPEAVALWLMERLLGMLGGTGQGPRSAAVERLVAALRSGESRGETLHGCRLFLERGRIWLVPEHEEKIAPVMMERGVWGGYQVQATKGAEIGALGRDARDFLPRLKKFGHGMAQLPPAVIRALPCARWLDAVRCVPHIGLGEDGLLCEIIYTPAQLFAPPMFRQMKEPPRE